MVKQLLCFIKDNNRPSYIHFHGTPNNRVQDVAVRTEHNFCLSCHFPSCKICTPCTPIVRRALCFQKTSTDAESAINLAGCIVLHKGAANYAIHAKWNLSALQHLVCMTYLLLCSPAWLGLRYHGFHYYLPFEEKGQSSTSLHSCRHSSLSLLIIYQWAWSPFSERNDGGMSNLMYCPYVQPNVKTLDDCGKC